MDTFIKEIGKMICLMEKVKKFGLPGEQLILEIMLMELKKELVVFVGEAKKMRIKIKLPNNKIQ